MPSDLQHVAQGLVECLDEVPQTVVHLRQTATRLRQRASWIADLAGRNPYGRQAAMLLHEAARWCDEAAFRAASAPPTAGVWAQTMVGSGSASAGAAASSLAGSAAAGDSPARPVTGPRTSRTESRNDPVPSPRHQLRNSSRGGPRSRTEEGPPEVGRADAPGTVAGWALPAEADRARDGREVAVRVAREVDREDQTAIGVFEDAYRVAQDFPAPLVVKAGDDLSVELRNSVTRFPDHRVVFVGRDTRSLAVAVAELDPDLFRDHCSEVVLPRTLVQNAVRELGQDPAVSASRIAAARRAAEQVYPAESAVASDSVRSVDHSEGVRELTKYLRERQVPVGMPSSQVTLVGLTHPGAIEELLGAVYPETRFDSLGAFDAQRSRDDPQPKTDADRTPVDTAGPSGGNPSETPQTGESQAPLYRPALAAIARLSQGPEPRAAHRKSGPSAPAASGPSAQVTSSPSAQVTITRAVPAAEEIDGLDGIDPRRISERLTDVGVREGVMQANLVAVERFAHAIANFRDSGGDYRRVLSEGVDRYHDQIGRWSRGAGADPRLAEFLDSFVPGPDADLVASGTGSVKQRTRTGAPRSAG